MSKSQFAPVVEMKTTFNRGTPTILNDLDPVLKAELSSFAADDTFSPSDTHVQTRVRTWEPEKVSDIMKRVASDNGHEVASIEVIEVNFPMISEISRNRVMGVNKGMVYRLKKGS